MRVTSRPLSKSQLVGCSTFVMISLTFSWPCHPFFRFQDIPTLGPQTPRWANSPEPGTCGSAVLNPEPAGRKFWTRNLKVNSPEPEEDAAHTHTHTRPSSHTHIRAPHTHTHVANSSVQLKYLISMRDTAGYCRILRDTARVSSNTHNHFTYIILTRLP